MAARVNKEEFESKVLGSSVPVLVDFYSDSCVPCKRMSPVIADIEEEREGRLAVYKVNINFDGELAEKYGVMSAPTFILFDKGEQKASRVGAARKEELNEWLDSNI